MSDEDYVFEDHVDLVRDAMLLKGKDDVKKGKKADLAVPEIERSSRDSKKLAKLTAHEELLAVRKKLPVYAYREEFLEAVQDNQVLIVVGEEDRGSVRSAGELAERLPRAHCVEIPGAGHVVNLAAPAAFNRALEEFLAEQGWV